MHFLPDLIINLDAFALFGITIIVCLIFGELMSHTKVCPRISAYILLGYLLGPNLLGIVNKAHLSQMQVIIDMSLGLITFSIGRHLDVLWLKHDKGLLYSGTLCYLLVATIISSILVLHGRALTPSMFAGIIIATTSPAVILLISRDLRSQGPITRRTLILTSINNFLALISISILLPFAQLEKYSIGSLCLHSMYRVIVALLLGLILFKFMEFIARQVIGKQRELQFILLVGIIALGISLGNILNVPSMLVLVSIGVLSRNIDKKRALMEIDFGWLSHLLFIPLFFVTGCYFDLTGFYQMPLIVAAFILLRSITYFGSNLLFTKLSTLTFNQSIGISAALMPMTEMAIGMTSKVLHYNPQIGQEVLTIISAIVGILGIVGPIITQTVFYKSGEAYETH